MKSEHRHDLETNERARRLATLIERVKPYATTVLTVALVAAVAAAGFAYVRQSAAARQSEAWDAYNLAVQGRIPDMEMLKQSAELHAGSPMAQWSNVTWADGQLRLATVQYIGFRESANESLAKAESMYQGLLRSATDARIRDRGNFGLGRVFEMRNNLVKAREYYRAVTGEFAGVAAARAEQLESERIIDACEWLASAKPPPRRAPRGPGEPGLRPEFEVDDLTMPLDEMDEADETDLEDILKGFSPTGIDASTERRYEPVEESDTEQGTDAAEDAADARDEESPAVGDVDQPPITE